VEAECGSLAAKLSVKGAVGSLVATPAVCEIPSLKSTLGQPEVGTAIVDKPETPCVVAERSGICVTRDAAVAALAISPTPSNMTFVRSPRMVASAVAAESRSEGRETIVDASCGELASPLDAAVMLETARETPTEEAPVTAVSRSWYCIE
jgi:hypothetical protein